MQLQRALEAAVAAAREAGALLRAEFLRPDGPRGPISKCPADNEAEALIRARLIAATRERKRASSAGAARRRGGLK